MQAEFITQNSHKRNIGDHKNAKQGLRILFPISPPPPNSAHILLIREAHLKGEMSRISPNLLVLLS